MQTETYQADSVAAFMRSRDRYGDLSNMTFGFPLAVNGAGFQGPEGLYQALKFPHTPRTQRLIASQRSGMEAKKTAYRDPDFRPDWEEVKVQAMALTLAVKLAQHGRRFSAALEETGNLPIVERSSRDPFWGAQPRGNTLVGTNTLGKLLTQLRDELRKCRGDVDQAARAFTRDLPLERFTVNGRPVTGEALTAKPEEQAGPAPQQTQDRPARAERPGTTKPGQKPRQTPRPASNRIQFG